MKDWQTLAAGSFALVAAIVGWLSVQRQMRLTKKLAQEETLRKFSAARANLPLALSSISDYAYSCGQIIRECFGNLDGAHLSDHTNISEFPAPPIDALANLTSIVEHSPDNDVAEIISDLLGKIQVANSRVQRLHIRRERQGIFTSVLNERSWDFAEIHARASDMYAFARRKTEGIENGPDLQTHLSSLRQIGFLYDEHFDDLEAWTIARFARNAAERRPRSRIAIQAIERWLSNDQDAALKYFKITQDEEFFCFGDYRYSSLSDAIAYSALEKHRAKLGSSTLT